MGNLLSSWDELGDSEDKCQPCENSNCYEEIPDEVNDILQLSKSHKDGNCFCELAEEFEEALNDSKDLCLTELEQPIKETALSLKKLASVTRRIDDGDAQLSCNCREWGPDVLVQGKWICNICGDKCQCDKQGWENLPYDRKRKNMKDDHKVSEITPVSMDKCSSDISTYFCDGGSLKGKGSEASSYFTRSRDENMTHDELQEVKSSDSYCDQVSLPKKTTPIHKTNHKSLGKIERNIPEASGIACPCNCGFYQEGDFKICPCGCNQIVQIVDDFEQKSIDSGPSCKCGDAGSGCPDELSLLSIDTDATGLMTAIELLQMKCRVKDGIIAVLASELRNSDNVDHIVENLAAPCLPLTPIDFDLSMVYEYIKETSTLDFIETKKIEDTESVAKPENFRIVRTLLNSLFLAWDIPERLCNIRGYEILVNGVITSRIESATRSQAILTSVNLRKPAVLTLFAVSTNGHISEASIIRYP